MARNRTSFHKILENVVWMTGAEIVGRGISFVTMVHLSRTLEPAGMGVVDFGLSVFVMVQIFTLGGVEVLGTRLAARSERRLRALAGTVCLIGWIFFALAYACVVGLLPLLAGKSEMRTAALLFALATFLAPLGLRFAYLGRERLAIPAIASVLVHAGILGLVLMLVRERDDLRIVPFIWIGCESLRALLQYIAFRRRYGGIRLRLRWLHLRAWLAAALPLTVSRVGRGFLLVLDLLMLGFLASPAEVGFYGVGLRIPQFLATLALLFHHVTFAALSRAAREPDGGRYRAMSRDVVRVALFTAVPIAFVTALNGEILIVTLFGEAYRPSVPILQLLVWKSVVIALGGHFRNLVLSQNPGLDPRATATGLAATTLGLFVLIPLLGGRGAAIATLVGESLLLISYAAASSRGLRNALGALDRRTGLGLLAVLAAIALAGNLVPPGASFVRVGVQAAVTGIAIGILNLPVLRRVLE